MNAPFSPKPPPPQPLRVLVACEYSGIVRDAFRRRGHHAVSCDLIPSERPGPHVQMDVIEYITIMGGGFDLMIAHPPCTYLASSGLHWNKKDPGRNALTDEAFEFVLKLMSAPIPHIALENPVGIISTRWRRPDQVIQPYLFGHPESKKTCLWLKDLPPLVPTNVRTKPESGRWDNQTSGGHNKLARHPQRWKDRSRSYTGIAAAMAHQYSLWIHRTRSKYLS